nr:hypothetical protein [uncultured Fluviicola sp.]
MKDLKSKKSLFKSELAEIIEVSPRQLSKLMNETYYEELKSAGYNSKDSKQISPKVLRAFFDCHGVPFSLNDLID